MLKLEPVHCRPSDLQRSQLLPARELQEWRFCQARSIALGCECSWVNKWKQKENWLWRSWGEQKKPNQTPELCRQQGALHPMCLLFFCWANVWNPASPEQNLLQQMSWGGWMRPCGYHCSTSSKLPFPRGSELSKLGKCHTRAGGMAGGQQQGLYTNQLAPDGCARLHHAERGIHEVWVCSRQPPRPKSPNKVFAAIPPSLPCPVNHSSVILCGFYS